MTRKIEEKAYEKVEEKKVIIRARPILYITGRIRVNIASLNATGTVGNYTALQRAHIILKDGKVVEVPGIITGNMVKHWHAIATRNIYEELGGTNLCDWCRRGIMYRSEDLGQKKANSEQDAIRNCAIHDIHGFLALREPPIRRESTIKCAAWIPAEEYALETTSDALTFNRVVVDHEGKITRNMMIIKREHVSILYGVEALMNVYMIGRAWAEPNKLVIDKDELVRRVAAAILAWSRILFGEIGSARARSQPALRVEQLIVVVSKYQLPAPIHGFYEDYVKESLITLSDYVSILSTNLNEENFTKIYVYGIKPEELLKESWYEQRKSVLNNVITYIDSVSGIFKECFTFLKEKYINIMP